MGIYYIRWMKARIADTEKSSISMQWLHKHITVPSPLLGKCHHNSWDTVRNGVESMLKLHKESSDRELVLSQVVNWAGSREVQWGVEVSGGASGQGQVRREWVSYRRNGRSREGASYWVHSQTVNQLHKVLIGFSDLIRAVFTDFTLHSVFRANSRLMKLVSVKLLYCVSRLSVHVEQFEYLHIPRR